MKTGRTAWLGWALWLGVAGASCGEGGSGPAESAGDRLLREGREAFRSCTTCHCATDPRIPEDEDWLRMNETTACIDAGESTPEVRKALNAYLRSDRAIRPPMVDEAYMPKEGLPHGAVGLPEVAGSAFLKAEGEQVARGAPARLRLYWQAGEKGRTLVVPAGEYRVISYALYGRGGEDNTERWMMTASNINGCLAVKVEAGKTVPLDLAPVFRGKVSAEPVEGATRILFSQTDRHGNVATLSVHGEVRLPEYRLFDGAGRELHHAVFENT